MPSPDASSQQEGVPPLSPDGWEEGARLVLSQLEALDQMETEAAPRPATPPRPLTPPERRTVWEWEPEEGEGSVQTLAQLRELLANTTAVAKTVEQWKDPRNHAALHIEWSMRVQSMRSMHRRELAAMKENHARELQQVRDAAAAAHAAALDLVKAEDAAELAASRELDTAESARAVERTSRPPHGALTPERPAEAPADNDAELWSGMIWTPSSNAPWQPATQDAATNTPTREPEPEPEPEPEQEPDQLAPAAQDGPMRTVWNDLGATIDATDARLLDILETAETKLSGATDDGDDETRESERSARGRTVEDEDLLKEISAQSMEFEELKQQKELLEQHLASADQVMHARILASTAQKMRMHNVTKSMNAWRAFVARKARTRNMMSKVIGRIQNVLCAACLMSWRQTVVYRTASRAKARRVVMRIQNMALSCAFVDWHRAVA
eukprot:COSAG06_NODE_5452_length_3474_cov_46.477926_4_plen_441_part_01